MHASYIIYVRITRATLCLFIDLWKIFTKSIATTNGLRMVIASTLQTFLKLDDE